LKLFCHTVQPRFCTSSALTSDRLNPQRGRARYPGAPDWPNLNINLNSRSPSPAPGRVELPLYVSANNGRLGYIVTVQRTTAPTEERFVPVNPFERRTHIRLSWFWCCSCSSFRPRPRRKPSSNFRAFSYFPLLEPQLRRPRFNVY
jgi:hypothetical protein